MKKFTALIIAFVMLFSAVSAGAKADFLTEIYKNYTANYTLKTEFKSADEVFALLETLNLDKAVGNFADIKKLAKTLFSADAKMVLQADMSEDMKKTVIALTAESEHNIDFNKNLKVNALAKTGIWIDIDLQNRENPKMRVIYSYPFAEKYMVVDAFEALDASQKEEVLNVLSSVLSKEFISAVNTYTAEVLKKYADIKESASKTVIKIDDEALKGIMGEIIPYIAGRMGSVPGAETLQSIKALLNVKILGDKGITETYTFKNGKISAVNVDADICIDIAPIVAALTGMEEPLANYGEIKFSVKSDMVMSSIGTTSPKMPILTEENSFSLTDLLPQTEEEEAEIDLEVYWAGGTCADLPVKDGKIYVPLRATLESAYADRVNIGFENGVVTAQSDFFPSFKKLTLNISAQNVNTDSGLNQNFGAIIKDGITYVDAQMFENVFGWSFYNAAYDMLNGEYYYEFAPAE